VSASLAAKLNLDPALSAHLVTAERLDERRGCCPTGIGALDRRLGGGWPLGALSELCGRRSSGRTSVLLASLASALAAGHAAALVDTDGALDPRGAAAAGIDLARLLWVRAGAREALKAADLLIAAGGFGLVALDLGEGRGRIASAAWVRLRHGAERQRTAVVVAAPRRTVGAFATAAVNLSGRGPRFDADGPPLLVALETSVDVTRRRRDGAANDVTAQACLLVRIDRGAAWGSGR
jgi:hypothetical protein